jgi:hypothetical protein
MVEPSYHVAPDANQNRKEAYSVSMTGDRSAGTQQAVQTLSNRGAAFSTVLPRLISAYEQGRLVPFIGAGLSVPACRLWEPFVTELEKQAGGEPPAVDDKRPDALIMRANRAIGRLRALGPIALAEKVRSALYLENRAVLLRLRRYAACVGRWC